jgi:hypothetical protein
MWIPFIIAWTALALLIAAPFETIGAALGGYVGFLIGYQTGQGAGVLVGIIGFLIGVSQGYQVRRKLTPNWGINLGEGFALALILGAASALIAYVVMNWSVK